MVTVKTTCPSCGDVDLDINQIKLQLYPPQRDQYTFICPGCESLVTKFLNPRDANILLVFGADLVAQT